MPRINPKTPKHPEDLPNNHQENFSQRDKSTVSDKFRRFLSNDQPSTTLLPPSLLDKLDQVWESTVVPVLIKEFGEKTTLYGIFFTEVDELIMEIWDPQLINSKASQVFKIPGIPQSELKSLPKDRSKAKVMTLDNWNHSPLM